MPDEPVVDGQVSETPPVDTGQATPETFIDVDGEQVSMSDAVTRLRQDAAVRKEMHGLHEERAQDRTRLDEYKSWADPIRESYNSKPEYQQGFDALYSETGQQAPVSQDAERLRSVEQRLAKQDMDGELAELRAAHNISKEDEAAILHEVAVKGSSVQASFRELFWDREIKKAADGAQATTAERMADNQGAYNQAPPGSAPASASAKDVNSLYKSDPEAHRDAAIQDIVDAGLGSTGWDV